MLKQCLWRCQRINRAFLLNGQVAHTTYLPPHWHHSQLRLFKAIGEKGGGSSIHAFRLAAFGLGAHGVEIDEPGFKQRLSDGFQGGVGFA
ncbi:hypothetical protein D9M71_706520 [compost metagenome]